MISFIQKNAKIILLVFVILIIICVYLAYKEKLLFYPKVGTRVEVSSENSGQCTLKRFKEWSIDCGGGLPMYVPKCGHWEELKEYSDNGKSCSTGNDCCSGFCGKDYNGKLSCITYGSCSTYIDKDGNLHKELCIR
jgi:hypothetical protein